MLTPERSLVLCIPDGLEMAVICVCRHVAVMCIQSLGCTVSEVKVMTYTCGGIQLCTRSSSVADALHGYWYSRALSPSLCILLYIKMEGDFPAEKMDLVVVSL